MVLFTVTLRDPNYTPNHPFSTFYIVFHIFVVICE